MFRRNRYIRVITGLFVLTAVTATATAQPRSLGSIVQKTEPLTTADQRQVREYVEYWTARLADEASSAGEAAEAAEKLLDAPSTGIASPTFLSTYSREAIPRLTAVLEGDDEFAAVQAARAMGFLGTPDAVEALVPWCNSAQESRSSVRLWAARGCQVLITRTMQDNQLNQRVLEMALRELQRAAVDEDDWLVLHRLFEAMAAPRNAAARARQVDVFKSVTRRIDRAGNEPSPLMKALTREIVSLRDQYLKIADYSEQSQFGSELAPVVGAVLEVANGHWEQAQQQPDAKATYEQAIQLSEGLLRLIDGNVRAGQSPPATNLHRAWVSNDRPRFETETKTWMDVLQAPPYKP